MKKSITFILLTLALLLCVGLFAVPASADGDRYLEINETNFPDAIFRQWVIDNLDVSGNAANGYYMTEEQVGQITSILVSGEGIANVKGIEHFAALKVLWCSGNQLTTLDVSRNTALEMLECDNNQLTALDVSKNIALETLHCSRNQLTQLDVSNDTALMYLNCELNELMLLNVSQCTKLESLNCGWNKLTALDVSHNIALIVLNCGGNGLTALNVSNNTALEQLICYCNLNYLDVSHNKALKKLNCWGNALTTLDVSNNTLLTFLSCSSNKLTALNVSNNTALEELICWDNPLTTLDVSNNTALKRLQCSENQLTALDVSRNISLTELDCGSNQLTTLDVSHNTALETLLCNANKLSDLDVSNNFGMKKLWCQDNRLTTLDVSHNTKLEWLDCHANRLTNLDVNHNASLIGLGCQNNELMALDVSYNTAMQTLYCDGNKLTTLDVSHNKALETLHCYDNQLTTLDLSANTALSEIKMTQKFKGQTLTIDNGSSQFDLSTLVPLEKMGKVTASGEGTLNKDTGIVTFTGYVGKFTYQYATGHGAMDVMVYFRPIIITQPKDVTVEVGQTATITVEAIGENLTYQWESRPNAESEWTVELSGLLVGEINPIGFEDKNGWQFRCIVKGEGGETCSDIATLTVKLECPAPTTTPAPTATPEPTPAPSAQAPTIAQQPKDVKVKSGSKAKFTVKTKEKDVSFQWFVKAPGANDWEALKGGAKNTLTVTASGANNGAQYRCLVKNKQGGEVYTNAVKLTVTLQPPVIKTQPKNQNVKSGAKAKLSVKASGKNIAYQWYERANGDSEWKAVSGGNRNTLNVVASKANDGHQYYCYLKNADGEAKSVTVTLTVKTEAPTIKTQPKNAAVKGGAKAKFSVKAGGKNLKYQWYERANADAEWTTVSGGTKSSLQVVASKAKNGYQYYCKVTNPDGTASSAVVTLTVTPQPPKFSTQPKDTKVKVGAKAKFKVKASGKNVTYQWYYRENEDAEWKALPGATKASYEIKKVAAENIGWQFKCQAKNADGEVWSKVATLLQK